MTVDELMALADDYASALKDAPRGCSVSRARCTSYRNALRSALEQVVAELESRRTEVARYACFTIQAVASLAYQPLRSKDIALMVSLLKAGGLPQDHIEKACEELRAAIDTARKASNANT